jgi:hypothetical protein
MKKIFTLIAALVLTVATTFAADRKPSVTLKSSRNYEVVIDGRSYQSNGAMQINLMGGRQHSIKVYEVKKSGFGFFNMRSKKLVDASTFQVGRNDIDINVDFRGQIRISEDRFDRDGKWNDRSDRDHGRDKDWNNHF